MQTGQVLLETLNAQLWGGVRSGCSLAVIEVGRDEGTREERGVSPPG